MLTEDSLGAGVKLKAYFVPLSHDEDQDGQKALKCVLRCNSSQYLFYTHAFSVLMLLATRGCCMSHDIKGM